MTRKFLRFLSGTFAQQAALGVTAFALAGVPMLAAHAQAPNQPAPSSSGAPSSNPNQTPPNKIVVTPAQKAEIDKIYGLAMNEIQTTVLTPEQKAQVAAQQSAQQPESKPRRISLNYSDDQKLKIRSILGKAEKEIVERVLTPEQRRQLQPQPQQQMAPAPSR